MRKRVNRYSDRKYFTKFADRTKRMNLSAMVMRGGVRL